MTKAEIAEIKKVVSVNVEEVRKALDAAEKASGAQKEQHIKRAGGYLVAIEEWCRQLE